VALELLCLGQLAFITLADWLSQCVTMFKTYCTTRGHGHHEKLDPIVVGVNAEATQYYWYWQLKRKLRHTLHPYKQPASHHAQSHGRPTITSAHHPATALVHLRSVNDRPAGNSYTVIVTSMQYLGADNAEFFARSLLQTLRRDFWLQTWIFQSPRSGVLWGLLLVRVESRNTAQPASGQGLGATIELESAYDGWGDSGHSTVFHGPFGRATVGMIERRACRL